MTVPANLILESAPYGAQPVVPCLGPQGGPYTVRGPAASFAIPNGSRTNSTNSAIATNYGYRGIAIHADVSVNPGGAQTLTFTLKGVDPMTGISYDILVVPASTTPGGHWFLYPGLSGAAVDGVAVTRSLPLPSQWFIAVVHSGGGAWSYRVSVELLP